MNKIIEVEALADVHTHLREGEVVAPLIEQAIAGGADVLGPMPNTKDGLRTAREVAQYIARAERLVLPGQSMRFIPFVMITEDTTNEVIDECRRMGIIDAKIYPYMRTTKSQNGIIRYGKILPIIKHCGEVGMKCHFHPEHSWMTFDNRDAEYAFLPLVRMFIQETNAHIIWEHGTDARCIPFWEELAQTKRFSVTLTAHHLATNEDREFGNVRSVCKPPIKTERDRQGLVALVAKDYYWVMAGSDSAYHDKVSKHVDKGSCNCGAFTAPFLLPLYAHALESLLHTSHDVQTFINFTSRNARRLHNLPEATYTIILSNQPWKIPLSYPIGTETALPFWAGETLRWKIVD